jgi:dipeptidyl aminopeptidase/acylaminoacyl peptidase
MGGTPEEKPAVYRKANILPDVDRIRTPRLILHGEQDPQVPGQFAEALRRTGKKFRCQSRAFLLRERDQRQRPAREGLPL